jgi:hypothetical protein
MSDVFFPYTLPRFFRALSPVSPSVAVHLSRAAAARTNVALTAPTNSPTLAATSQ